MSQLGIVQRILNRNKETIQELEAHIEYFRYKKSDADEKGYLQDEYYYHEMLKAYRAELAKYVKEQRYLKALVKGQI